jgi:hypothetical protein
MCNKATTDAASIAGMNVRNNGMPVQHAGHALCHSFCVIAVDLFKLKSTQLQSCTALLGATAPPASLVDVDGSGPLQLSLICVALLFPLPVSCSACPSWVFYQDRLLFTLLAYSGIMIVLATAVLTSSTAAASFYLHCCSGCHVVVSC